MIGGQEHLGTVGDGGQGSPVVIDMFNYPAKLLCGLIDPFVGKVSAMRGGVSLLVFFLLGLKKIHPETGSCFGSRCLLVPFLTSIKIHATVVYEGVSIVQNLANMAVCHQLQIL